MPRPLKFLLEVLLSFGWLLPAWLGFRVCLRDGVFLTDEAIAFVRGCVLVALPWIAMAFVYCLCLARAQAARAPTL